MYTFLVVCPLKQACAPSLISYKTSSGSHEETHQISSKILSRHFEYVYFWWVSPVLDILHLKFTLWCKTHIHECIIIQLHFFKHGIQITTCISCIFTEKWWHRPLKVSSWMCVSTHATAHPYPVLDCHVAQRCNYVALATLQNTWSAT